MKAVAFKVTYNDGGAGAGLIGFRDVCSDRNILENVHVRKMTNCSSKGNPCRVFADNNFTGRRPKISSSDETWCYEAGLFRTKRKLRFGSGYYHHGEREGEPISMTDVKKGDIALLTTLLPGGTQQERIIFGCFRVGKDAYLKEGFGYMAESDGTMDIQLPDEVARKMNFWRYFKNANGSKFWGTGLFRYLNSENTKAVLTDLLGLLGDHQVRDILLNALPDEYLRPIRRLPPVNGSESLVGGFGGGESDEHLRLKNYVAKNPKKIGLPPNAVAYVEFPYLSGDRVDVKFDIPGGTAAVVEVETIYTLPGAHQCVKYRALLEAELGHKLGSGAVEAILVAHRFDEATEAFAKRYGIRLVQLKV